MTKITDANKLDRIYMSAIGGYGLDDFDPPASKEDWNLYYKMRKEIKDANEKTKQEGRSIVWEIPFDIDFTND